MQDCLFPRRASPFNQACFNCNLCICNMSISKKKVVSFKGKEIQLELRYTMETHAVKYMVGERVKNLRFCSGSQISASSNADGPTSWNLCYITHLMITYDIYSKPLNYESNWSQWKSLETEFSNLTTTGIAMKKTKKAKIYAGLNQRLHARSVYTFTTTKTSLMLHICSYCYYTYSNVNEVLLW